MKVLRFRLKVKRLRRFSKTQNLKSSRLRQL